MMCFTTKPLTDWHKSSIKWQMGTCKLGPNFIFRELCLASFLCAKKAKVYGEPVTSSTCEICFFFAGYLFLVSIICLCLISFCTKAASRIRTLLGRSMNLHTENAFELFQNNYILFYMLFFLTNI